MPLLQLVDGCVVLEYAGFYHKFDEVKLNDDTWHTFRMTLLSDNTETGQVFMEVHPGLVHVSQSIIYHCGFIQNSVTSDL